MSSNPYALCFFFFSFFENETRLINQKVMKEECYFQLPVLKGRCFLYELTSNHAHVSSNQPAKQTYKLNK